MKTIQQNISQFVQNNEVEMVDVFRYLHMNPELSFKEINTTKFIKDELSKLDIEIIDIGTETGVVGLLNGDKNGPCVALRADIDGLPVTESSKYDFKSKIDGVMHACGHDIHMSSLLGAAKVLAEFRNEINGSVKFIFQHAEERNQGAKIMIEKGVLENPKVDVIFGLHNSPDLKCGEVAVKKGPLMAAVDRFEIAVKGKGGHGGVPHRNIDPVVVSAAIINSLQSIVSRNINPNDTCVVSVCSVHAGEGMTYNVIPEEVKMVGTCRSYNENVGNSLESLMRRIVTHTAEAYNAEANLEYYYDQPAVINPENIHKIAVKSVTDIDAIPIDPIPSTGGEDFTFFMQKVPGYMYWLGVGNTELECIHPWHSPKFRSDERCIGVGASLYSMSVFNAIQELAE